MSNANCWRNGRRDKTVDRVFKRVLLERTDQFLMGLECADLGTIQKVVARRSRRPHKTVKVVKTVKTALLRHLRGRLNTAPVEVESPGELYVPWEMTVSGSLKTVLTSNGPRVGAYCQ